MTVQNNSGIWTDNGDPLRPQPKMKPAVRKLSPYHLLPHLTDRNATAVYAYVDGVLKYRGKIWEVESYSFTDEDERTINCGPGWLALPKGWTQEPDHFGGVGDTKGAAIGLCLTCYRKEETP